MSSAPREVLHVCEPTHAGAAQVTFNLASGMRRHGFQATVCTPPGELAGWCHRAGIRVLELPFSRRDPAGYARAARVVARSLRDRPPAIVHAHSSFSGVLVRGLAPRRAAPLVFQPHAWSFQALTGRARLPAVGVERLLASRTDLLVCVSEDERAAGEAAGVRPRATVVIPNGVDFDVPGRDRAAEPPGSSPVLGVVARLTRQKGVDVLLHAIADPAWPPAARVEIAGDGPLEAELVSLAGELGVADRVRFLGRLPTVADRLRTWDLYLSPARYEGASIALLEAIAAGVPVVCTDVAGVAGLTDPRRPPVPVEDPPALARAVAVALGDPAQTRAAAAEIRDRARARFSLQAQAAAMAGAYRGLLEH